MMKIVLGKGQFLGPISGADETIVTYAAYLRAANHRPSVLLMFPHAEDDPYYVRLKKAGVTVSTVASAGVQTSLSAGRKLVSRLLNTFPPSQRLVRRKAQDISTRVAERYYWKCREYFKLSRADVVHVVTPDPSAAVMIRAARDAGLPVIYQELGIPYHPPAFAAYYEQFVSAIPLCSELTALSPALTRQCREQLPCDIPISVLPIMAEDLLSAHGPPPKTRGDVTFGFAARLEPLKGPLVLVEAFAAVSRRSANSFLKVAGVGSQRQRAVKRAEAAGVAHRCDFMKPYSGMEEKSAFMRSLDVFVLPSLTEGTPNSIVEAMSCGLPIIASAVGGVSDMITPETGLLVPPGEPAALADAMNCLAVDRGLRERMGRAARRRYEEIFSLGAVSPLLLSTYRRVAENHREKTMRAAADSGDRHPWSSFGAPPVPCPAAGPARA